MNNMTTNKATYDTIGKTYDATRCADSEIVNQLYEHLKAEPNACYLDVGCGSGNYTCALASKGLRMTGIDISEEMLRKARLKNSEITWFHGDAQQLPFKEKMFHGAVCTLATHHFKNLTAAFQEIFRVIIKGGRLVLFTSTPEQMKNYWLCHYFPTMLQKSSEQMTSFITIKNLLKQTGFTNIQSKPFFVTNDLQDLFLYSGKYRPAFYLNPTVRAGISSFASHATETEINHGLANLERDIQSGKINEIIKSYENKEGDYLFVVGEAFS